MTNLNTFSWNLHLEEGFRTGYYKSFLNCINYWKGILAPPNMIPLFRKIIPVAYFQLRTAISILFKIEPDSPLLAWHVGLISKFGLRYPAWVRFFIWEITRRGILTNVKIHRFFNTAEDVCLLCNSDSETINHLFTGYTISTTDVAQNLQCLQHYAPYS